MVCIASPSLDSSLSQDQVQRGSSPSQVQVQMRRSKQRKKKIIFFKTTYLIIDHLFDSGLYRDTKSF